MGMTTNKIDKCTTSSLGKTDVVFGYRTTVIGRSKQCKAQRAERPIADLSAVACKFLINRYL
jgi:hypothetical protein